MWRPCRSLDLVRLHADVGPLLLRGLVLHAQDDSHGFKYLVVLTLDEALQIAA